MTRPLEPAAARAAHPVLAELVGGLDLSIPRLEADSALRQMFANAEYWLSFQLADFEPLLAKSPSPLRELGVAVALRFSDRINGELSGAELERAKSEILESVDPKLRSGLSTGLSALARAVATRDRTPALLDAGFSAYTPTANLSVHALRAMGKANIAIEGTTEEAKRSLATVGETISLSATDERGRPLAVPEIESRVGAPLLVRDDEKAKKREAVFLVPGEYVLRVPGRASGARKVLAR